MTLTIHTHEFNVLMEKLGALEKLQAETLNAVRESAVGQVAILEAVNNLGNRLDTRMESLEDHLQAIELKTTE